MSHDESFCQCPVVQCRRYANCGQMDRMCNMVPAKRVHPGFKMGRFCRGCATLLGWRPAKKPEPRKKPYTARELRVLADGFHHPEPVADVSLSTYHCAVCELPLYYNKRKGWCHDPISRVHKVKPDVEGQIPLF